MPPQKQESTCSDSSAAISNNPDKDAIVDVTHDAVLKRFHQVASQNYPFQLPPKTKPTKEERLVELTSKQNLRPLLISICLFMFKITRPLVCILFSILAWWFGGGLMSSILSSLAVVGAVSIILYDPFLMHWVSDGRLGCVGTGDVNGGGGGVPRDGIFCSDTPRNNYIKTKLRRFVSYRPTPYLFSGDLLTLAPFLLFKGSVGGRVSYQRWWIKVPSAPAPDGENGPFKQPMGNDNNDNNKNDDEAVALDVAFSKGGYDAQKPTFLVLHGLNGGSTEPYVLDLVRRANKEGSTVAVMINRGLMKTPVRGMESFTGSRTSDVGCAVDALLYALGEEQRGADSPKNSRIILVGFSMGGILAANYTAKSNDASGLVGAISFSGTLCSEKMLLPSSTAAHSLSVWQPALAWGLKGSIVKPNQTKLSKRGNISKTTVEQIRSVVDIDTELVCRYHGYAKVQDYYEDMSAGGRGDDKGLQRLNGAKVPLLAVHAIDDPIAIYEVALQDHIEKTENVMLLTTKHGGHIGWPQGFFPSKNRWAFMIDIALEFSSAVGLDNGSDEQH